MLVAFRAMNASVSVLLVADSNAIGDLLARELRGPEGDLRVGQVRSRETMFSALTKHPWDIVVAEDTLPHFSGLAALRLVQEVGLDLPVIIVSDRAGEEKTVEAMRAGAQDYITRGNLARLVPAIQRELREAEDRRERRRAEAALRKTERELDEAQRDLVQSEKMAALGRFSSGLAHEIKNPLGIIVGGVEFLETKLADADAESRMALAKVKEAALRGGEIVDRMLTFAQPSDLKLESVSPAALVEEAVSLFRYGVPSRDIRIATAYPEREMRIRADRNQMQQVLFDLLSNAVDALPGRGEVLVSVRKAAPGPPFHGEARCVISVVDNGVGIPRENLPRIFEPFFTTKREQMGTGLGLPVARSIVERHHGLLEVESEAGKGTQARIILPLASEEPRT